MWKEDYVETPAGIRTAHESYYELACLAVSLLGLLVRGFTVGYTPRNTSGRNTGAGQVADSLNTSGIYSVVRHPLYLGNYLMWLGVAMLPQHAWFAVIFSLVYWIYYERIMFAEEQFLRGKFGEAYTTWAARTPAFLPDPRGYRRCDLPFSWKKVLKKEKNGFCAIFLGFALFHLGGESLKIVPTYNYALLYAGGASVVIYLVLKFLKKRTVALEDGR
jgi:protein-S-isoprenylcysteine O-methyltransferase Ste14